MEYGYVIVSKWLVIVPNIGRAEGRGRMDGRGIPIYI
jgi:hypothetical protein